jgi:glycosyltransferase involved in cell wall biosynthesis
MKILWLTWKDHQHPEAGGAEVLLRELSQRLVHDGHDVTWLTCGYEGAAPHETIEAVNVIRVGKSRYTHPFVAFAYYLRHFRNKFDIVIEEVNGSAPYFAIFFGKKSHRFLLYYQLGRKNWLYEVPKPLAGLGYHFIAPIATRIVSWAKKPVITISESSRQVLAEHGLSTDLTKVISVGIEVEPIAKLDSVKKYANPTLLSIGTMRAMKRTLDQVKAFEIAKQHIPSLRLKLAGSNNTEYGKEVLEYVKQSPYTNDIDVLGKVDTKRKIKLMQQSHLTMQTAVEEGWGLTITEAASQGTPAVTYNIEGLRDSVRNRKTGLITDATPEALAGGIVKLLSDKKLYERLSKAAWEWSKEITFDNSYRDFRKVLGIA